jgi:hypothetical protein
MDLSTALTTATTSDTVRIAGGSYLWDGAIHGSFPMPRRLEGGFAVATPGWRKDLATTTVITINPVRTLNPYGQEVYVGVDLVNRSSFVVADLSLQVLPAGAPASATYGYAV